MFAKTAGAFGGGPVGKLNVRASENLGKAAPDVQLKKRSFREDCTMNSGFKQCNFDQSKCCIFNIEISKASANQNA